MPGSLESSRRCAETGEGFAGRPIASKVPLTALPFLIFSLRKDVRGEDDVPEHRRGEKRLDALVDC